MRHDLASVFSRCDKVRAGLVAGFSDETLEVLEANRPGLWVAHRLTPQLPYEDCQFDVAVLHPDGVDREHIREIYRVLKTGGHLFFTVDEFSGPQDGGYTPADIYELLRKGFDILEMRTPKWWHFGLSGKRMTVSARKKAWRERKPFIRTGILPFTPFRSR